MTDREKFYRICTNIINSEDKEIWYTEGKLIHISVPTAKATPRLVFSCLNNENSIDVLEKNDEVLMVVNESDLGFVKMKILMNIIKNNVLLRDYLEGVE